MHSPPLSPERFLCHESDFALLKMAIGTGLLSFPCLMTVTEFSLVTRVLKLSFITKIQSTSACSIKSRWTIFVFCHNGSLNLDLGGPPQQATGSGPNFSSGSTTFHLRPAVAESCRRTVIIGGRSLFIFLSQQNSLWTPGWEFQVAIIVQKCENNV